MPATITASSAKSFHGLRLAAADSSACAAGVRLCAASVSAAATSERGANGCPHLWQTVAETLSIAPQASQSCSASEEPQALQNFASAGLPCLQNEQ